MSTPATNRGGGAGEGGAARRVVERVQTGVRMEKRLLMVLRALADAKDMTLGDLLEGIVLHALEGKAPFSRGTLEQIATLKGVFGMALTADDSHKLVEAKRSRRPGPGVEGER